MLSLFRTIAEGYTPEAHLLLLKVGGLLCGWGDIAALSFVLRASELITGRRPTARLLTLKVFIVLNVLPILAPTIDSFYVALFVVLGVPYLMLAYTAVTEAPTFIRYIKQRDDPGGV